MVERFGLTCRSARVVPGNAVGRHGIREHRSEPMPRRGRAWGPAAGTRRNVPGRIGLDGRADGKGYPGAGHGAGPGCKGGREGPPALMP